MINLQKKINLSLSVKFPNFKINHENTKENNQFWKTINCNTIKTQEIQQLYTIQNYQKLSIIINHYIETLEHNESIRQKYQNMPLNKTITFLQNNFIPISKQTNINSQIKCIQQLAKQANYSINNKQQLIKYLEQFGDKIFIKTTKSTTTDEVWILSKNIDSYDVVTQLTDNQYLTIEMDTMQKLLVYREALNKKIQRNVDCRDQLLITMLKKDDLFGHSNNAVDKLIAYILKLVYRNVRYETETNQKTSILRGQLIYAVKRAFYMAYMVKIDLSSIDEDIDRRIADMQEHQNDEIDEQRRIKVIKMAAQNIHKYQNEFKVIEKYLCEPNEEVITLFYNKKINKILIELNRLKQKCKKCLLNIKQLKLNKNIRQKSIKKEINKILQILPYEVLVERIQQIRMRFKKTNNQMNQQIFQQMYEELENIAIELNKIQGRQRQEQVRYLKKNIVSLEFQLIQSYQSNKNNPSRILYAASIKSAIGIFSEQSYGQNQINSLETNLTFQQYKEECQKYLKNINLEYAEEFEDQINFNTNNLSRLIQMEKAYENLNIEEVASLKNIQSILQPQISSKRIPKIFNPKVSTKSYHELIQKFEILSQRLTQIQLQHSSKNPLSGLIFQIILRRQNILKLLIKNLIRLQKLVEAISTLQMNTRQFEVSSQITQSNILNIILANKELNAYQKQLQQGNSMKNISVDQFIKKLIYLPLHQSLERIVKKRNISLNQQELIKILETVKYYIDFIKKSDSVITLFTNKFRNKQITSQEKQHEKNLFSNRLIQLNNQLNHHLKVQNPVLQYSKVQRQKVRIQQIIQVCSGRAKNNIVDERVLNIQRLLMK